MPKLDSNSVKNTSVANKNEDIKKQIDYSADIEELRKQNEILTNQLSKLMNMFKKTNSATGDVSQDTPCHDDSEKNVMNDLRREYTYNDVPKEVSPNKQIMIMSLCYGSLNLSDDNTGKTVLRLSKYGECKPVLYSTLINIVNSNRRFAETGKFYILDKDAVYHLGLSEFYKNLISKDIIDNILNYSPNIIESIIKTIDSEQRDLLIRILCDKVYRKENIDINKILFIEKTCGVDIMKKVEEMKQFDSNR